MSGGFFRGTSADQDTRFSNKQAKLLKSQKFAPELDHLVDMTKVKMDVMKPWIAKRVTELIGFEDEVLINFIYGLLEGKAVNGKQVQISVTGFMERNTGKFMKELWTLLLSAQQNVSGVPQQFLDAKEEETKKKKAETDRIADEIQKKKEMEKKEFEQEKRKMDDISARSKDKHAEMEPSERHGARGLSTQPADEKEMYKKNGYRRRSRDSPSLSPNSSYSPRSSRKKHSPSSSKSSSSQSHSDDRRRSRNITRAHLSRSRSMSPDRVRRSSPRRSVTPRRRHISRRSPSPWHRSSHSRRRSASRSQRRSRSPAQYRARSPLRYRSRSPLRRRSRSPVRHKSRTPIERSPAYRSSRMPTRRRSPSPYKGRSPSPEQVKHLYPRNRGSPSSLRRRAPFPLQHRSPFRRSLSQSPTIRRYERSPTRSLSPVRHKSYIREQKGSLTPVRQRSPSSGESGSPTPVRQTSLSPVRRETLKTVRSHVQSTRERIRRHENHSSGSTSSDETTGRLLNRKGTGSVESRGVVPCKSPERNMLCKSDLRGRKRDLSPSNYASDASGGRGHSEERRSISPHSSPSRSRGRMIQHGSVRPSPKGAGHKSYPDSGESAYGKQRFSGREIKDGKLRSSRRHSPIYHKDFPESDGICEVTDGTKSRNTQPLESEKIPERTDSREAREQKESEVALKMTGLSQNKYKVYADDGDKVVDKKNVPTDDRKGGDRELEVEALPKSSRNIEPSDLNGLYDSSSGGIDKNKVHAKENRKQKRLSRQEEEDSDEFSSYDSWEERKEMKRRRKEEKILRKEERRRRREERSRRKEERHAAKHKIKATDVNSSSSDLGPDISEGESVKKRESRAISTQDVESEQKRAEIELREKALKSLRAKKKGSSN